VSLRVLAVSIAPLFEGAVHGGSQRILLDVVRALASAGHRVRVVCSARPENEGGFEIPVGRTGDPVGVEPLLRLSGFFPDPYEVPPNQLADTARSLAPHLDWADRVYLHADIFHFRSLLPAATPLIRSFHDYHYETALVSAFAYGADVTVVPSDYLRRCIEATVGRSGLRELERVEVIPNGIDLARYRPGSDTTSRKGPVLLHPHRSDPRKGIDQALRVVAALKRRGRRGVRLVVPRHIDAAADADTAAYYDAVEQRARGLGVEGSLDIVPWKGEREMPALYRSANVTLCLGNFIESFGLTAYESLACGTPVIAARVGALRDIPEIQGVYRVEHDDIEAATDAVEAAGGMRDAAGARRVLQERFSIQSMQDAYVRVIEGATGDRSLRLAGAAGRGKARIDAGGLEMSPWCHIAGDRVYNDYAYRHLEMPKLAATLARGLPADQPAWRLSEFAASGVPRREVDEALRAGVLIPASVSARA
jgi:glycosyltransferase involved in cell wall biosynthesis